MSSVFQNAGVSWQIYQDMADNFTDNPLAGFEAFRRAHRAAPGHDPQLRARGSARVAWRSCARTSSTGACRRSASSLPTRPAASTGTLQPGPGRGLYRARAGCADRRSAGVEPHRPAADVRRERRLLRPHAAAGSSFTGGHWLGGYVFGQHRGRVPPPSGTGRRKYDLADLRGRPYGLGPRVPLYVISPWSRGGWVDSQVYDHTSVIRLIERRFGVAAPDISPWRRAVCGDLSNAFDFAQRDTRPFVRGLPDVSAVAARAAALPGRTVPSLPEGWWRRNRKAVYARRAPIARRRRWPRSTPRAWI